MTSIPFFPEDLLEPITFNPSEKSFYFLDLNCAGGRVVDYVARTYPMNSLFLVLDCFFVSNPEYGLEAFLVVEILCPDGRTSMALPHLFRKVAT